MIREYSLSELGYFTQAQCERIREKCEGTYMNIKVSWSNCAGNCSLILVSDYDFGDMTYEEAEKEIKCLFLNKALSMIRR